MASALTLRALPPALAVCRLPPDSEVPPWSENTMFSSVTRTADELSIVCLARDVPPEVRSERGWKALEVEGPLDFSLVGIVADLSGALARAEISLFVVSTFDTDYLLVKEESMARAVQVLSEAGHTIGA